MATIACRDLRNKHVWVGVGQNQKMRANAIATVHFHYGSLGQVGHYKNYVSNVM